MADDFFHMPLDEFEYKITPTYGSGESALTGGGSFAAYLLERSPTQSFPDTFDLFIEQWAEFSGQDPLLLNPQVKDAFTQDLQSNLKTNSDWASLGFTQEQYETVFEGAFNAFIKAFPHHKYDEVTNPLTEDAFFDEWEAFMTVTTYLLTDTAASGSGDEVHFATFETIYKAYFPNGDFETALAEFVANFIEGKGYFLPSQHVDDWQAQLQADFERTKFIKLSGDERIRRSIMLLVFKILRTILERLQETASIQAQRLTILAQWQSEYTELMGRVPLYQAHAPRLLGPRDEWEGIIYGAQGEGPLGEPLTKTNLAKLTRIQIDSGLGAIGGMEPRLDQKGFAGITLEEIRELDLHFPTQFGYTAEEIAFRQAQIDAQLAASGVSAATLEPLPSGTFPIPSDHPFYALTGQPIPGVWWLVEQPYDGGAKYLFSTENTSGVKREADARQDVNQVRQQWIEQLRSYRNIVKDEAKQVQTDISQTKEAINQQSNLMTSIIQQLSGILQSIFR